MTSSDSDVGDRIRRQVLGDEYVDGVPATWAGAAQLQELVTRFAWGTVWNRPHFDLRTRSLLTVGILTALNRRHELELHIGGALRNGCSMDDLIEVAIQSSVYCGIPAAVDTVRSIKLIADSHQLNDTQSADPGA